MYKKYNKYNNIRKRICGTCSNRAYKKRNFCDILIERVKGGKNGEYKKC